MSTPRSVAVAVSGGSGAAKGSRRALQWAMENVVPQADRLILVHVIPRITSIPSPGIDQSHYFLYHFHKSYAQQAAAMNSASVIDRLTAGCFFDLELVKLEFI
jgi:hypothetical protein